MHYACLAAAVDFVITGGAMTLTQAFRSQQEPGITLPARLMARHARYISMEHCSYLTHQVMDTTSQRRISPSVALVIFAMNFSMVF
jgi:hypothetical protein